jgi:hypothetical protein
MAYKDKHAITDIVPSMMNNLSISVDYIGGEGKVPVMLFTPNMNNTNNHYHIPMTREEAVEMLHWLQAYLQDTTK